MLRNQFLIFLPLVLLAASGLSTAQGRRTPDTPDQAEPERIGYVRNHGGVPPAPAAQPPWSPRLPSPPWEPLPYGRPIPAPTGPVGISQITNAAGIIFLGRVVSIARVPATAGPVKTVAITCHVEQAIRGVTTGQNLTIFEWIGLWTSGQRYRVGQRALLFLYPPSKLGLTSSVGGTVGRFAVDELGRVIVSQQHLALLGGDPGLSGKSRVSFGDFAQAVRRAEGEE